MSYKLDRYIGVKSVFTAISTNQNIIETSFKENKDTLALCLEFTNSQNEKLDYYYIFGNSQVIRMTKENDIKVMTTNPERLHQHICWDIEDFIKGKEIS